MSSLRFHPMPKQLVHILNTTWGHEAKKTFYKDWENCEVPFTHIEEKITDPTLKKLMKSMVQPMF